MVWDRVRSDKEGHRTGPREIEKTELAERRLIERRSEIDIHSERGIVEKMSILE